MISWVCVCAFDTISSLWLFMFLSFTKKKICNWPCEQLVERGYCQLCVVFVYIHTYMYLSQPLETRESLQNSVNSSNSKTCVWRGHIVKTMTKPMVSVCVVYVCVSVLLLDGVSFHAECRSKRHSLQICTISMLLILLFKSIFDHSDNDMQPLKGSGIEIINENSKMETNQISSTQLNFDACKQTWLA